MKQAGMTLPELLVAVSLLGLMAALACHSGSEILARQRLESASRQLSLGLERARSEAERRGRPCGLSLAPGGWAAPTAGTLPPCLNELEPIEAAGHQGAVAIRHNMPAALRFSSNGLVLDGGTVVLSARGTTVRRCLVMALPLGIVRLGRYGADPTTPLSSSQCLPDPSL